MTQTLPDHARVIIREEIGRAERFVDAKYVAAFVQIQYPDVDFESLIDAVIEETLAARGSVAWEKSVDENPDTTSNRMIRYAVHR